MQQGAAGVQQNSGVFCFSSPFLVFSGGFHEKLQDRFGEVGQGRKIKKGMVSVRELSKPITRIFLTKWVRNRSKGFRSFQVHPGRVSKMVQVGAKVAKDFQRVTDFSRGVPKCFGVYRRVPECIGGSTKFQTCSVPFKRPGGFNRGHEVSGTLSKRVHISRSSRRNQDSSRSRNFWIGHDALARVERVQKFSSGFQVRPWAFNRVLVLALLEVSGGSRTDQEGSG